jgi:hypothetical protein
MEIIARIIIITSAAIIYVIDLCAIVLVAINFI